MTDIESRFANALIFEVILALLFSVIGVWQQWPWGIILALAATLLMGVITVVGYIIWGCNHKM
jgi:hypothetical protein